MCTCYFLSNSRETCNWFTRFAGMDYIEVWAIEVDVRGNGKVTKVKDMVKMKKIFYNHPSQQELKDFFSLYYIFIFFFYLIFPLSILVWWRLLSKGSNENLYFIRNNCEEIKKFLIIYLQWNIFHLVMSKITETIVVDI